MQHRMLIEAKNFESFQCNIPIASNKGVCRMTWCESVVSTNVIDGFT